MQRTVERRRRRRGGRIRVGPRTANRAHRVRAAVLLVVRVQDEEHVHRPFERRVRRVLRLRHLPEHAQEVPRVRKVVVRVNDRQPAHPAVGERRQRRHLGDQAVRLDLTGTRVVHVLGFRVKRAQRRHRADQHAHRMRIVVEALHELPRPLVHERVVGDVVRPLRQLRLVWQFAVDDQVGGFEEGALLRKLFDWVAAVLQDARVPIDVGDCAPARGRVRERRVVDHQPEVIVVFPQLAKVHRFHRAIGNRQLNGLARAVVGNGDCVRKRIRHERTAPEGGNWADGVTPML